MRPLCKRTAAFFLNCNLFSLLASFEESVESVDPGAFVTVPFLWRQSYLCSLQTAYPFTLPSEALRWVVHMGYAGSSAAHGHLRALSSCSNSFLFQWSQSQTSGKSQWLTHCWSARDCEGGNEDMQLIIKQTAQKVTKECWKNTLGQSFGLSRNSQVNIVKSAILLTDV